MQLAEKWPEMVVKRPFMSHKFYFFFLQNGKIWKQKTNVFYVIAFDPIKIQTCSAPQNGCENLSLVKVFNVVGRKMARNGLKMVISYLCDIRIETDYNT